MKPEFFLQAEIITAEMPGIQPDDINLNVVGETLTLRSSQENHCLEASVKNGVLHLRLPKAGPAKARKITVKSV